MRRPRRVGHPGGLVRGRQLQQRLQRARRRVDAGPDSPSAANRAGIVSMVNSAGSQPGTSSQVSGADTRASGPGRTEYAEATVRSLAFWL